MSDAENKVIVFGCGKVGFKVKEKLEAGGLEVIAFSDNDSAKWGTEMAGKPVIAPDSLHNMKYNYIAIGIYKAADAVKKQLIKMGIKDNQILIPLRPQCIFYNDQNIETEDLNILEQEEYESKNTKEYESLQLEISDKDFLDKLENLKKVLQSNNIPLKKVCVVSGAVLQAYNLRNSKKFDDIDIIMTSDLREFYGKGLVIVSESAEMHPKDLYTIRDDEIILDKKYHFIFNGLKFMTLKLLYDQVKAKDKKEALLIEKFLNEWRLGV